jgi:hypothetical protein
LFLFSAVYLMTVFPEARVLFYEGDDAEPAEERWEEADFVFVPAALAEGVRFPRLDLTIERGSFQSMTTEQVRAYVSHAFELGSVYLYSLNPDRSPRDARSTAVRSIIAERFWSHEVLVLPVGHRVPGPAPRTYKKKKATTRPDPAHEHVVAWRRMRT